MSRKRDDQLIEWHGSLDGLRRVEWVDRKRRSVPLRLVECLRAWRFAGHLELTDLVRKPVGGQRRGSIGHLEVQMRHDRVAGISDQPDDLAGMNMFPTMNLDAPRLHVGI